MSRLVFLLVGLVVLASCGVPEVDLDLPDRAESPQVITPNTPGTPDPEVDSSDDSTLQQGADPGSASPPDPTELDELEQLVSEIESLLEGVSDELDQITFEEEGG